MGKSQKRLKELEVKLLSDDEEVISYAINQLRNEASFEGVIHLLSGLFETSNSLVIKNIIRDFLIDLKEPMARIEVISELRKTYSQETKCMLVSSCWQSGLDYSEFVSYFADLFIEGEFSTALECFTVFEESAKNIPENKRKEITKLLVKNGKLFTAEKRALNQALIELIK